MGDLNILVQNSFDDRLVIEVDRFIMFPDFLFIVGPHLYKIVTIVNLSLFQVGNSVVHSCLSSLFGFILFSKGVKVPQSSLISFLRIMRQTIYLKLEGRFSTRSTVDCECSILR